MRKTETTRLIGLSQEIGNFLVGPKEFCFEGQLVAFLLLFVTGASYVHSVLKYKLSQGY